MGALPPSTRHCPPPTSSPTHLCGRALVGAVGGRGDECLSQLILRTHTVGGHTPSGHTPGRTLPPITILKCTTSLSSHTLYIHRRGVLTRTPSPSSSPSATLKGTVYSGGVSGGKTKPWLLPRRSAPACTVNKCGMCTEAGGCRAGRQTLGYCPEGARPPAWRTSVECPNKCGHVCEQVEVGLLGSSSAPTCTA